jgi:glutamyl-tRNA reductase
VPPETVAHYLYDLRGNEAIRHLFRVASSLDSMIVGEPQILGQFKQAYRAASAAGTVGLEIGALVDHALLVAKRVRTETGIAQSAVSVSYAAVELARKIFGDLRGRSVMIIGASKMGELAARHLERAGVSLVLVTNRTFDRAVEMAQLFDGAAIPFEQLGDHIDRADIVISSTGAPHFVITRADAENIIRKRKNKPVFFIDIAVPRDIDPAVNAVDNVFLYDIDDLQKTVDENLRDRLGEASRAEDIIDREVLSFCDREHTRNLGPTIVAVREAADRLRREVIERHRRHLGPLTAEQQEALDRITQSLVNSLLHRPVSELKRTARDPEGHRTVDLIRRIFDVRDP